MGQPTELEAQARAIVRDLDSFKRRYRYSLPPALNGLFEETTKVIGALPPSPWNEHYMTRAAIAILALETEADYLLADTTQHLRLLSERAFEHLQRSIAADKHVQERWKSAFEQGETQCERLGAVHLLSFGIFAFKAHSESARTDLVFPDRRVEWQSASYSEGIVLTEWKVARTRAEETSRYKEAMVQAELYSSGILAGIELATVRYLVVVSERQIQLQPDEQKGDILYRKINIAVDPRTPSEISSLR